MSSRSGTPAPASDDLAAALAAASDGYVHGVDIAVDDVKYSLDERQVEVLSFVASAGYSDLQRLMDAVHPRERWLSPDEAAAILGVSRPTVVRWAKAGELADHAVGSHHKFSLADVEKLRAARAQRAEQARAGAAAQRAAAVEAGADLDAAPTPQEMAAAGVALWEGRTGEAASTLARARRSAARRSAAAARQG